MNILITGGLGFIGSHLAKSYLSEGHLVTIIDNCSTNCENSASPLLNHSSVNFIRLNLADVLGKNLTTLDNIIKSTDLVQHFASSVGVKYIDKNPKEAIRNNININQTLFPLLEKYQKKLIFSSSSEVYGENSNAKETDDLKIGTPNILRWGYSCSKLMSEFLLKTYTFPHVILRLFNITGRGQLNSHGMVLPSFIDKAIKKENLTVYGDGTQYRSFCDIRDAIAMIKILSSDNKHIGEIYNIGNSQNTLSIKELASLVLKKTNSQNKINFENFENSFTKESKDIQQRRPNTEKISKVYSCKYTMDHLVESMLD